MGDFPIVLTEAVDNVTDVLAKHINNIEAKIGVDSSAVTTSHDYKIAQLETNTHVPVTVTDSDEIDFTLTGQDIKADIKTASVAKSKLDSGVQTSLGKADSAIQDISGKQDTLGFTPENSANKVTSISGASTDVQYPSAKLVYNQLAGKQATGSYEVTTNKENTTLDTSATKYPTSRLVKEYADGKVEDSITDGRTTVAPSGNAVFDALALKAPLAGGTMTGKLTLAGHDEVGKTYTPATGAQTVTIDCSVNNVHIVSGHADGTAMTFAISNCTNSQPFIVSILQGAVVSTIAAWFATVRWAGGTAPTLTATVGKRDTFGFIRTGADTYDGFVIGQNC